MRNVATAASRGSSSSTATGLNINKNVATGTLATKGATPSNTGTKVGAATVLDYSSMAKAQVAQLATPLTAQISSTSGLLGTQSFEEAVEARTAKLTDRLKESFKKQGILMDDPIKMDVDQLGHMTTHNPYKKKIEKIFENDPDLAKEFKDVASLHNMMATQKALEAFEVEKKKARNDDEIDAAYGRFTARLMKSQALSGTLTLDDDKLRSASVDFMARSVGEVTAAQPSEKAKTVAARRLSRLV